MRLLAELGRVIVFGLLLVGVMALTAVVFRPAAAQKMGAKPSPYSLEAMQAAVRPSEVAKWIALVADMGNRFAGTPGHERARKYLGSFYQERGFEVFELPVPTVVPVVESCQLTIGGTEIAATPFLPNYFQTDRTPKGGLKGTLVLLNDQTLISEKSFAGKIAVVDAAHPPRGMALNAMNYLRIGVEALILTQSPGTVPAWGGWSSAVTSLPVSFPRVYADPAILNQIGREAVLDVRVRYESQMLPTIVGRLKAPSGSAREAVIMGTHYDTYSLLPWHLAPPMQVTELAQHLALVDGVSHYRDSLSRDVIVVASGGQFNAHSGDAAVLQMVGPALERWGIAASLRENLAQHEAKLKVLKEGGEAWRRERLLPAIQQVLYQKTQERILARAEFQMEGGENLKSPAYRRFFAASRASDRLRGLSSMSLERLAEPEQTKQLTEFGVEPVMNAEREMLERYHQNQIAFWQAGVRLHEWASGYSNLLYFTSNLQPHLHPTGRETLVRPYGTNGALFERVDNSNGGAFREAAAEVRVRDSFPETLTTPEPTAAVHGQFAKIPSSATLWTQFNYPAISLFNADRNESYLNFSSPFTPPGDPASFAESIRYAGGYVLALTHGVGALRPPQRLYGTQWNFGGRVLVAGVGQSIVPNFPLAGALLGGKSTVDFFQNGMGMYPLLLFQADPYGEYRLEYTPARISENEYNLQAFGFDENGLIDVAKNEGLSAQKTFRSKDLLHGQSLRNITLVGFPARGVTVLDLINPQTLTPYSSVSFSLRQGLSAPEKLNVFVNAEVVTAFMEPDQRFVTIFNAGSSDNELVQKVRAFALGPPESNSSSEINGRGYFVLGNPVLRDIYQQTAESMVRVNGVRAELQDSRHMLDPMTRDYFAESRQLLDNAAGKNWLGRLLETWNSIAYSIMVHPILLSNVSQAVTSIVWYLCLLVPFVFFIEKLVFGYADIRRQLVAQSVIFFVSFLLLRLLHPAFGLIRSSLVILLGFLIFLICVGITLIFASKAAENLEPLRRKQGKVKAADASPLGVMATAFMLGLNNMHRRKVRTGLTCGTLVLITFAMIAFTSIYQGYENREVALGPAAYQGLMIKKERTAPILNSEINALISKYASRYPIYPRRAIVGKSSYLRENVVPKLGLVYVDPNAVSTRAEAKTIVYLDDEDPIRKLVPLLPGSRWVKMLEEQGIAQPGVVISDQMAEKLGIVQPLPENGVPVELNGNLVRVVGLFNADALNEVRDLDGRSILPFDIDALQDFEVNRTNYSITADNNAQPVSAAEAIFAPIGYAGKENGGAEVRSTSVLVGLDGRDFHEAGEVIQQFVEQTGESVVYGLDGSAWRAVRRRSSSFEGLVDLIIPLILAAVTVLNTMKGSVYERKSELGVYNAVGIAPRYIFMMFFAEALVYAVVGSVLGYFLSQGVGAALTALDLTGGLNMTFASLNSIYASLAVVVAVFISTYFPAKTAVQIAAPAEESGWKIPEPKDDVLEFALPFVFDARERLAVLAFFRRYFANFTEGEGGLFQTSELRPLSSPYPGVAASVWLKPFDQGVSQEMEIFLPPDTETGEFCARVRLRRLSGTSESWTRLNRGFVSQLRRQFLHWRAVEAAEKESLFAETREWFLTEAKS